jgi:hypothetical protein
MGAFFAGESVSRLVRPTTYGPATSFEPFVPPRFYCMAMTLQFTVVTPVRESGSPTKCEWTAN